jgi:hypothetical protein
MSDETRPYDETGPLRPIVIVVWFESHEWRVWTDLSDSYHNDDSKQHDPKAFTAATSSGSSKHGGTILLNVVPHCISTMAKDGARRRTKAATPPGLLDQAARWTILSWTGHIVEGDDGGWTGILVADGRCVGRWWVSAIPFGSSWPSFFFFSSAILLSLFAVFSNDVNDL